MIYLISDTHFCHDREFLYGPRGFENVGEMNKAIVENWNNIVSMEDDVYLLGDVMLNDNEEGIRLLKQLKGKIHIILGNHDTDTRIALYKECDNVVEVVYATMIKYNKYTLYLSHYPTITTNIDENYFSQHTLNIYGHTHQKEKFYHDNPFMLCACADAWNCTPFSIDEAIVKMITKYKECGDML